MSVLYYAIKDRLRTALNELLENDMPGTLIRYRLDDIRIGPSYVRITVQFGRGLTANELRRVDSHPARIRLGAGRNLKGWITYDVKVEDWDKLMEPSKVMEWRV